MSKKIPAQLVLERRLKIWDLRQRGYTYELIAKEVGVSNAAVCKVLQRITKKYREQHLADVERVKAEQVAELEQVGYEAFQAWERSKEAAKMIRQKKAVSSDGQSLGLSEQTLESREQDGDPRYLQVYMKSKEDIRKIIGADAPIKSEVKFSELDKLSDDELLQKAQEALNAAAAKSSDGVHREAESAAEMDAVTGAADSSVL